MKYPEPFEFESTLAAVCLQEFLRAPDRILLSTIHGNEPQEWTVSDVMTRAMDYATQLIAADTKPDDAVAVMLDNHPDHVAVMIALGLTGVVWLPLDRRFTAANVRRVLSQVISSVAIVEHGYVETVRNGGFKGNVITPLENKKSSVKANGVTRQKLESLVWASNRSPNDVRALLFTSGTTGPPKGVVVTERMYMASARFCGYAGNANKSAVFYLWEPLNHIGGAQIIPMAFMSGCSIAMTEKFSTSRFWSEVVDSGANRIHYLGGVLELLLRQEESINDRQHNITLGFGAGASSQTSHNFTKRFGIPLREVYGMTEASSFTTINIDGPLDSIGKALPDFDLVLTDNEGQVVDTGVTGEIVVKPNRCALVTPHYYKNDEATDAAFRDDYFRTGDLAFQDENGYVYFVGRHKELIRSKGENISPWELESVFKQHASVLEVAIVGVDSDVTEQDIVAFIRLVKMNEAERHTAEAEIRALLSHELAPFQQPKHIVEVSQFPKTPSERIEKHKLDVSPAVLNTGWDMISRN